MIYHEELFRNMESTLGRDTSPDHNMSSKFIHLYKIRLMCNQIKYVPFDRAIVFFFFFFTKNIRI